MKKKEGLSRKGNPINKSVSDGYYSSQKEGKVKVKVKVKIAVSSIKWL